VLRTEATDFNVAQYPYNPILIASSGTFPTGNCANTYSQEIVQWSGGAVLLNFYGGWEGTANFCHDQVFLAYSTDGGMNWRKYPADEKPSPVLALGSSQHVNDPSIVIVGNQLFMYYTDNYMDNGALRDHVWLATSTSVLNFQKAGMMVAPGPAGSWCEVDVGRPAVIYIDGMFKMWYDGTSAAGIRSVGYATSTDGTSFTTYAGNPLFQNGGGIDVKYINGQYYMLQEGASGATLSVSPDGIHWTNQGVVTPLSGQWWDRYGQVVPSFQLGVGGNLEAIWFGGATNSGWDQNVICVAYPAGYPGGGGCSMCTSPGISCSRECEYSNISNFGTCGAPGSRNPGSCCACRWDGCQACVKGAVDCHQACVNAGTAGGYCSNPGSTNPDSCCACIM